MKRLVRTYKYQIIEYDYINLGYDKEGTKIEVCKTLHKTNSRLLYWLIILCFKIQHIRYDVVRK